MKKFSLLRCLCFAAILMPQVALAEGEPYTINGSTLTITTTSAGELSTFMSSATDAQKNAMKACTTIKLSGKFNSSDLTSIQASEGFSPTTVDMSEAQFVQTIGSPDSYKLYNGTVSGTPTPGTKAIQNVLQLYQSVQATRWNSANPSEYDAGLATIYTDNAHMQGDRLSKSEGSYGKYLNTTNNYMYRKLYATPSSWLMVGSTNSIEGLSGDDPKEDNYTFKDWTEYESDNDLSDNLEGGDIKVKVYRYFKIVDNTWVSATKEDWDNASQNNLDAFTAGQGGTEAAAVTLQNMVDHSTYSNGTSIRFLIFYEKQFTRTWAGEEVTPTEEEKLGADEAAFDYAFYNSHASVFTNTSDIWVKMPNYDYYQLQRVYNPVSYEWKPISFVEGDEKNPVSQIVTDANNLTTPSYNQYAVLCNDASADKKIYNGSNWETYTGSNVIYDYSQMKFSYWQNVVNAVTSKYADSNISGDIFSGCNSIQTVDFKAGVVKGLTGKTTLQTLNVGRDVTEIANAALKESGVQTVTFDKNYTAEEKALATAYYNNQSLERPVYPKDLTIGEDAFLQCSNLSQIEFPNRVISIGNSAFKEAGTSASELKVTFERRITSGTTSTSSIDYDHDLTIATSAFYGCTTLKKIDLPIRLSSLGYDAFKLTSGLESVTMREDLEDSRLTTIPSGAFQVSGLKSVKIPKSVTLIESNAFGSCYELTEIEFQESNKTPQPALTIKTGAFAGGSETSYKLRTVKLDYTHERRLTVCEFNAFNFTSLVGQTNVGSRQMATLVFPEEDWDFYAGNWKKGLGFDQSNLNAFKDGYSGDRGESQPTELSGGKVDGVLPANGWQQFALSCSEIELIVPSGNYIRSYSTPNNYFIPKLANNPTQDMLELYRVTEFSDGWTKGMDKYSREEANKHARIATAARVEKYIPANTGLIMVGKGEAHSYIVYQKEVTEAADLTEIANSYYFPYNNASGDKTNMLYPSCIDTGNEVRNVTVGDESVSKVMLNPTSPYPIGDLSDDYENTKFRIFGFKGAERKFYRSQPGVLIDRDMAYLKLPIGLFHWVDETGGTGSTGTGTDTTNPVSADSRILLVFAGEDDSDITIVKNVVSATEDINYYYTVQGQKIAQPQRKGLYIYNGKKIYVK